jgi:uncharacterized protein YjbI with pentapeptide repeats
VFKGGAIFRRTSFNAARFDQARFEKLAAFEDGRFVEATFYGATFVGSATFYRAEAASRVSFDRATFERRARFERAVLAGEATFVGARFQSEALFGAAALAGAVFDEAGFGSDLDPSAETDFRGARFSGDARFRRASFVGNTLFGPTLEQEWAAGHGSEEPHDGATFAGSADFDGASLRGETIFGSVVFEAGASFRGAELSGRIDFHPRSVAALLVNDVTPQYGGGVLTFEGATFEAGARDLGPITGFDVVILDLATFREAATVVVDGLLQCQRTRFQGGATIRGGAVVTLEGAEFDEPSILASEIIPGALVGGPMSVVSLRGANVGNVTLSNVHLALCRFAGAHNLDRLRIDDLSPFGSTPRGRRWTQRKVVFEEREWRIVAEGRNEWADEWITPERTRPTFGFKPLPPQERVQSGPLQPREIASIYRSLRKGREDSKDEPGAADFYYGEMEMRRHDSGAPHAERFILWLYWLLAGYGLRASRSFVALAVVVLVFALLFRAFGFEDTPGWADTLVHSAGTALLRDTREDLTSVGEVMQIALRLIGPVLLGLALLSIRGRVKR